LPRPALPASASRRTWAAPRPLSRGGAASVRAEPGRWWVRSRPGCCRCKCGAESAASFRGLRVGAPSAGLTVNPVRTVVLNMTKAKAKESIQTGAKAASPAGGAVKGKKATKVETAPVKPAPVKAAPVKPAKVKAAKAKVTGAKAASAASRTLHDPKATKQEKSAAASALSKAPAHAKP